MHTIFFIFQSENGTGKSFQVKLLTTRFRYLKSRRNVLIYNIQILLLTPSDRYGELKKKFSNNRERSDNSAFHEAHRFKIITIQGIVEENWVQEKGFKFVVY